MEFDPYYEPAVFLEGQEQYENKCNESASMKEGKYESTAEEQTSMSDDLKSLLKSGWYIVKGEEYSFPENVSEDRSRSDEVASLLICQTREVASLIQAQSEEIATMVQAQSSAAAAALNSIDVQGYVPSTLTFRKRSSWNTTFTSMVTTLRMVGRNPILSKLSVPTLQLLTDQVNIPSWLPSLPPGVSSTQSLHPSGEWFFPTETGLQIRKNAQPDSMRGRYILYMHGGAFCCCHTGTHRGLLHNLVHQTGACVLSVNYRRPPEHPYPIPVHDCLSAYLFLLEKVGDSSQIVFAGDSAGGNLVINTLILAAQHQLPQPAGAVLLSPWVDLTDNGRCSSWEEYADVDYLSPDLAAMFARSYAGDSHEVQSLSPLYSPDLHLLPPLLVEFGECEVLHDQIKAFCEQAHIAGVDIHYTARSDMVHVFPIYAFSGMKQCQDSFDEIINFFEKISSSLNDKSFKADDDSSDCNTSDGIVHVSKGESD